MGYNDGMDTTHTARIAKLSTLSRADVEHCAEKAQGRNELRNMLGVGGLYGRAVSAASEKQAAAALDGLRDGWFGGDVDDSEFYAGAELEMYRAARNRAMAVR